MYKRSHINYIETNYLAVKYIYCLLFICFPIVGYFSNDH